MVDIASNLRDASRVREGVDAAAEQITNRQELMYMLGPFQFSVGTAAPSEVTRTVDYRWPEHDRVGARPVQNWLGIGREQIELSGRIYPHFRGGLGQVQAMRELAGTGKAWILVDARGVVYGEYAIEHIEESGAMFTRSTPRRIDFLVRLVYAAEFEDGGFLPG